MYFIADSGLAMGSDLLRGFMVRKVTAMKSSCSSDSLWSQTKCGVLLLGSHAARSAGVRYLDSQCATHFFQCASWLFLVLSAKLSWFMALDMRIASSIVFGFGGRNAYGAVLCTSWLTSVTPILFTAND